jgi:hypothetical protein
MKMYRIVDRKTKRLATLAMMRAVSVWLVGFESDGEGVSVRLERERERERVGEEEGEGGQVKPVMLDIVF